MLCKVETELLFI